MSLGRVGCVGRLGSSRAIGFFVACVCSVCVWLAVPRVAQATVVVPAGVAELAAEATAIAHGRVVRIETQQGDGGRVERIVTVQVFDYLKGGLGNVVQLRVPGGTFGRYTTFMIGAPSFAQGDELVLFLGLRDGDTLPRLLGFHQGVYRVVSDPSTGVQWVTPPLVQGSAVQSAIGQSTPVTRGDVTRRPPTLDEFRGSIASVLRASAPPPAPAAAAAADADAGAVRRRR
jgi:hypothetical protein